MKWYHHSSSVIAVNNHRCSQNAYQMVFSEAGSVVQLQTPTGLGFCDNVARHLYCFLRGNLCIHYRVNIIIRRLCTASSRGTSIPPNFLILHWYTFCVLCECNCFYGVCVKDNLVRFLFHFVPDFLFSLKVYDFHSAMFSFICLHICFFRKERSITFPSTPKVFFTM